MNKNRVILILAIAILLLLVLNIGSCINAYNQNALRKKEMLQRLNLEEKAGKVFQERASLAEKIEVKNKELEDEKASFEAVKKALIQEQLVSAGLKGELEKVTRALEAELAKKSSTSKKAKK
ncbi:MAG: hypothetical protein PHO03_05875 [Candidatus Omnitrophica bacterium]|nr:hypothetical protein [Candidatus Omnitrophota bacterium]